MVYEPQLWKPGPPSRGGTIPTPARLNHMEQGIYEASLGGDTAPTARVAVASPSPVTDRSKGAVFGSETTDGVSSTGNLSRIAFTFLRECSSVEILYANFLGGNGAEIDGANPITIWCAVEDPTSGVPYLLTDPAGTVIPPNGSLWVKVPGYLGKVGEKLIVRSQVSVAAGGKFPLPLKAVGPQDGRLVTAATTNITTSTATADLVGKNPSAAFAPLGVRGVPAEAGVSFLAIGTSIGAGASATKPMTEEAGWYKRALTAANIPCHNLAFPASSAHQAATWEQRFRRMITAEGTFFTDALLEHGTNDFVTYSLATMQADFLTLARMLGDRIDRVWVSTTLPRTSDAAGVTVTSRESYRVAWNTWLRDGAPLNATTLAPVAVGTTNALRADVYGVTGQLVTAGSPLHPFAGVWEVADTVESARNAGTWASASLTSEGVHPTEEGHELIKVAVPVGAFT
jgi:hypothetical protein